MFSACRRNGFKLLKRFPETPRGTRMSGTADTRAWTTKFALLRWNADPTFNHTNSAIEIAERAIVPNGPFVASVVKLLESLVEMLAHFLDHSVNVFEDRLKLGMHGLFMLGKLVLQRLDTPFGATDVARQGTKFFEYESDVGLRSR